MAPEEGYTQFLLRTVAPICIAALIAISLGLVMMTIIGGIPALLITSTLVFCGFWIGWRRGEEIIDCLRKVLNK